MGTAQSRGANTFVSRDLPFVHGSFICLNVTLPASGNFNIDVVMTYNGEFRNGQTFRVTLQCTRDANTGGISGEGPVIFSFARDMCSSNKREGDMVTGQILHLDAMPHSTDKGRWIGVYRSQNPSDYGTVDCILSP